MGRAVEPYVHPRLMFHLSILRRSACRSSARASWRPPRLDYLLQPSRLSRHGARHAPAGDGRDEWHMPPGGSARQAQWARGFIGNATHATAHSSARAGLGTMRLPCSSPLLYPQASECSTKLSGEPMTVLVDYFAPDLRFAESSGVSPASPGLLASSLDTGGATSKSRPASSYRCSNAIRRFLSAAIARRELRTWSARRVGGRRSLWGRARSRGLHAVKIVASSAFVRKCASWPKQADAWWFWLGPARRPKPRYRRHRRDDGGETVKIPRVPPPCTAKAQQAALGAIDAQFYYAPGCSTASNRSQEAARISIRRPCRCQTSRRRQVSQGQPSASGRW